MNPALRRSLLRRLGVVAAISMIIIAVPSHWKHALFDPDATLLTILILAGGILTYPFVLARGLIAGLRLHGSYGTVLLAQAVSLAAMPLILLSGGLSDPFTAFCVGTSISPAAAAVAVLILRGRVQRVVRKRPIPAAVPNGRVGILVLGNLLMTANMFCIPAVLRLHLDEVSASVVAASQILVSVSRISTLAVASLLPVLVGRTASKADHVVRDLRGDILPAVFVGALTVIATTVLGPPLLTLVYGSDYAFEWKIALCASLSVLFLNPAFVLMATAIALRRDWYITVAWAVGLAALLAAGVIPSGGSILPPLLLVTVAALLPLIILYAGVRHYRLSVSYRQDCEGV